MNQLNFTKVRSTAEELAETLNDPAVTAGYVSVKDKFGDWALTEAGREIGGRMSKSNHLPVPTFEFEKIEKLMIDFYNKHRK